MSEAKHTPGPWTDEDNMHNGIDIKVSQGADGGTLATVWNAQDATEPGPEELANARLIAAAPDLLAALQSIAILMENIRESDGWREFGHWCGPRVHQAEDLALSTITKAKG